MAFEADRFRILVRMAQTVELGLDTFGDVTVGADGQPRRLGSGRIAEDD